MSTRFPNLESNYSVGGLRKGHHESSPYPGVRWEGTPGNYCLRMRVIKRLLLRNTTAVTNLMGWVSVVT